MKTWIFFTEDDTDNPEFTIQAECHESAFDKAYEDYGPQVEDLYYKELT